MARTAAAAAAGLRAIRRSVVAIAAMVKLKQGSGPSPRRTSSTTVPMPRRTATSAPMPLAQKPSILRSSSAFAAVKALEEREIDGFWADGMGAEEAARRGIGTVVLDA